MLIKSDVVNKGQNQKYILNFNQRLSVYPKPETLCQKNKIKITQPTKCIFVYQ